MNDTRHFFINEFNVKCDLSNIPKPLKETVLKQLTKQSCFISLKKFVLPPDDYWLPIDRWVPKQFKRKPPEEDGYLCSTSSKLNTKSWKRQKHESSFEEKSEEEDYRVCQKAQNVLPAKQNQVYRLESISETCLRFKKPDILPCTSQSMYNQVPDSISLFDTSSVSGSGTSHVCESNDVIMKFSSTTKNLHTIDLPSENVVPQYSTSSSDICNHVTLPLSCNTEEEKSPVFAPKKSQDKKTMLSSENQNVHASFGTHMKKDEGVQTDGFFEDLLEKIRELHASFSSIQEAIDHSKLSPCQSIALLQSLVHKVIEFCEPVTFRNSVPPHPSSSFASKSGGSGLQSTHTVDLCGSTQRKAKAPVAITLDSRNHTAKRIRIGPKSMKSSKLFKESSVQKTPVVVLNRLTPNELRQYGVKAHHSHLPSAKMQFEKRPRKTSQNSESSFSAMDSNSEEASSSSPVLHSSFIKPDHAKFNPEALDYEDSSLELAQSSSDKLSTPRHVRNQGSFKHGNQSDRVQETKIKSERKVSKERLWTKSEEREKKFQKIEKKNSESDKNKVGDKISNEHESKDGKGSENFVSETQIRKFRIPKTTSVLSASSSVGLPSLVQENLDRLEKGVNAEPPKIPRKPCQSAEETCAKLETGHIRNASPYQDIDIFHKLSLPKHLGNNDKSILDTCSSRKANGKGKVLIFEDLNSVRCISPIRRLSDTQQEEALARDQNQPPLPERYVASVLDELGYVPESSPRPLVKGIRPFHPPKVLAGISNSSVSSGVAERKVVPSLTLTGPTEATEPRYKRSWNRLSSSSSSDTSSPCVSDSESLSDEPTNNTNQLSSAFGALTSKSPIVQGTQLYSSDSSSSSSDAWNSSSSVSSGEISDPTPLLRSETISYSNEQQKMDPLENEETDESNADASPVECSRISTSMRSVLVSPYQKDAEKHRANSHNMVPTDEGDLKSVKHKVLLHREQDEDQEKELTEKLDDNKEREAEELEEEEDMLVIRLREDEYILDAMYYEEPSTNQPDAPKKNQQDTLKKQTNQTSRLYGAPLEQPLASLSIRTNQIPPEIPYKHPKPQNASTYRKYPASNSIPTARVMPQFETTISWPGIPPSPHKDIAAIISKGMCHNFMRTGQCPPKPHETCAYCHEDDPEILFAVIRNYCEHKKLLPARKLVGAMTSEQSPYHKYLKVDIGRKIVYKVIDTLLKENKNDHKECALSILITANIPLLPELVDEAITRAPESAKTALNLKNLYEKYTRAQIPISTTGWEKIVHILSHHMSWQETCTAIATALQAQRHYTPSHTVINYLFGNALQTKVVQRIEQVCDILKGVGYHAFAHLGLDKKRDVLNFLVKGSNPILFGIYKHLFEFDKLVQLQQTPHLTPGHSQHSLVQQSPPILANPSHNMPLQHNLLLQSNRQSMSVAHQAATRSGPNVSWPSSTEVSAILKKNVLSHPADTALSTIGRNLHFTGVPEARQPNDSPLMRNVTSHKPDPRLHAVSRSHGSAAMNRIESKLLVPPPALSNVPSIHLVKTTESNCSPNEKTEVPHTLVVPRPLQALNRNLFHNVPAPVQLSTTDAIAIVNGQPSSSVPPTSPFIRELDLLFKNQSFDGNKFEKLVELLMKSSAEHLNGEYFVSRLITLTTTTTLFDAENNNEELQLSAVVLRIVYAALTEGDVSTLPPEQQDVLLDVVGRVFCYLRAKHESATEEAEKDAASQESQTLTLALTPTGMYLEKCTKNPNVLIFIAECYVHKWMLCDPPQEEEGIEEFVNSIIRAFYILTEFHKVVADFNIEQTIVDYEHHVFSLISELVQLIIADKNGKSVINCGPSQSADIEGAMTDYRMEATKNYQRFARILDE